VQVATDGSCSVNPGPGWLGLDHRDNPRLLDLGARHANVGQTGDESWVCLADPEGNEFDVLAGRRP
jgi:hypothetical protein